MQSDQKNDNQSVAQVRIIRIKAPVWHSVMLGALTLLCIWWLLRYVTSAISYGIASVDLSMLIAGEPFVIVAFCVCFLFMILKRRPVSIVAKAVAYIFTGLVVVMAVLYVGTYNIFQGLLAYAVLFLPPLSWVWATLAVIGLFALFVRKKN